MWICFRISCLKTWDTGANSWFLLLYATESIEYFCTSSLVEWCASEEAGGCRLCRYLKMMLLLPDYSIMCFLITVFLRPIRCLYVSCLSANWSVRGVKLMFKNTIGHSTYIYSLTVNKLRHSSIVTAVRNNFPVDMVSHTRRIQFSNVPLREAKIWHCVSSWVQSK